MPPHLSPRENLLRAIRRNEPEYVPVRRMDGVIPGATRIFYHGSRFYQPGVDRWGVRWAGGSKAGREWEPAVQSYAVGHPLVDVTRVSEFDFPNPDEPGLMEGLLTEVPQAQDQTLLIGELPFLLFERAYLLMGMEALFVAMVDNPDSVRELLRRIADYQIAIIARYAALDVEAIRATDDYGGQQALLMSPRLWRNLIKPELARICKAIREAGLLVFLHSCGHIMELVPDLIEIGVDVLDPIQAQANDHGLLKQLYGNRLSFMCGVDSQRVLSLGTPAEVEAEVELRIRVLGPGGGYILGPDNLIAVPEENCRAYLRAASRHGSYPLRP